MSTVKIEAHVDVTNPAQVEALNTFLKSLGGEKQPCETKAALPAKNQKAAAKAAKDVEVKDAEVVAPETPAAQAAAEEAPAENAEAQIKIEDVRALLSKKVGNHRDAIKEKLTALGANNVTSLDKGKYQEFVDFLNGLA